MVVTGWLRASGSAATGLAALLAAWAGLRGLDAWRRETVGRRKAEIAKEVLAQFYRARDALNWARPITMKRHGACIRLSRRSSTPAVC
jgi:hypothetical protein